jgi:hypothetical protein
MPALVVDDTFRKRLRKKQPKLQGAILETIKRLADNPQHPGLQVHRVRSTAGVWEAYVDNANRVTFHYDDEGRIVMRNHCNHDILDRSP